MQTTGEFQFEMAVRAAKDAKFRRKFKTKQKLLLYPSDELCEKHTDLLYFSLDGDRALVFPDGSRENQYGYTDGIPNEHKEWYKEQEEKELKKHEATQKFDWAEIHNTISQSEDDYTLLRKFANSLDVSDSSLEYMDSEIYKFLSSTEWLVFRGYVKKEK